MNNNLSYLLKLRRRRKLGINNSATLAGLSVFGAIFTLMTCMMGWFLGSSMTQSNSIFNGLTIMILYLLAIDVGIKCIFAKSSIAELCALKLLPIPKYELYLQNIKNKLFSLLNYVTLPFSLPFIASLYAHSQITLSYSITLIAFSTILILTNTFIVIWIKSLNGWKREFLLVLLYLVCQALPILCMKNSNVMSVISENLIQNQLLLVAISIILLVLIAVLSVYQYKNEFVKFLENKFNARTDIVTYDIGSRFNLSPLTRLIIKTTIKNKNVIFSYLLSLLFAFVVYLNQDQPGYALLVPTMIIFTSSLYLFLNHTIANVSLCYDGISILFKKLVYQINKTDIKINYLFVAISSLCALIASKDINIALNTFFIGAGLNVYLFIYINNINADRFDIMKTSILGGHFSTANLQKGLCAMGEMVVFAAVWHFVENKYIITIVTSVIFVICQLFQKRILDFIYEKFNQNRYHYQSIMRGF